MDRPRHTAAAAITVTPTAILERNVTALQRHQPGFAVPPDSGRVQETAGVWRLYEEGRAGVALHSRDAQREADRAAEALLSTGAPDVIVAIGLALGFLADALERRGWRGRLLAIEPLPETAGPMLGRRDWRAWIEDDRFRVLIGPDYAGAADCWRWFSDTASTVPVVVHPVIGRIRPDAVAAGDAVLQRIRFDAGSNAEARRKHGPRYLLNTLRNLPAVASQPDVSALRNAARGLPVINVAAGPSLDSSLPFLQRLQGRAVCIAVDTALRPLLGAGIQPHAVVAVDPSEANGRHLTELPPCPDTFLVREGSLDPFAVATFAGRTFFFSVADHHPWPWLRTAGVQGGRLRAWGSVLTSAFDLALVIGADPIFFVGADLSYPEDRPYCRGVTFEEDWRRRERWGTPLVEQWHEAVGQWKAVEETGVTGAPVRTAPHLVTFRDWLVEQIGRENRRIVNAGGAGILRGPGIEQMAPSGLERALDGLNAAAAHPFRERYERRDPGSAARATRDLARSAAASSTPPAIVAEWRDFAPDLTVEGVVDALAEAARRFASDAAGRTQGPAEPRLVAIETSVDSLRQIAAVNPLAAMTVPPHRMEVAYTGARMFRFRTTAGAIMCCALRPLDGAVLEDGAPLRRVYDTDQVGQGDYAAFGDAVHFRASDGTDPRTNGRRYELLVPAAVIVLENLPFTDVLARDL